MRTSVCAVLSLFPLASSVHSPIYDSHVASVVDDRDFAPSDRHESRTAESLYCPSGTSRIASFIVKARGGGSGRCVKRYSTSSIEECRDMCKRKPQCRSFDWALARGSKRRLSSAVCAMYNTHRRHGVHVPGRIMCNINPTAGDFADTSREAEIKREQKRSRNIRQDRSGPRKLAETPTTADRRTRKKRPLEGNDHSHGTSLLDSKDEPTLAIGKAEEIGGSLREGNGRMSNAHSRNRSSSDIWKDPRSLIDLKDSTPRRTSWSSRRLVFTEKNKPLDEDGWIEQYRQRGTLTGYSIQLFKRADTLQAKLMELYAKDKEATRLVRRASILGYQLGTVGDDYEADDVEDESEHRGLIKDEISRLLRKASRITDDVKTAAKDLVSGESGPDGIFNKATIAKLVELLRKKESAVKVLPEYPHTTRFSLPPSLPVA